MSDIEIVEADKGAYLGSYETSRKKYWKRAVPITIATSFVCGLILFFYDSEDRTIIAGLCAGAMFPLIFLIGNHGIYLRQKFWMKAYENGIDFMQIGFFPWKDIFFYYHGKNGKKSMVLFRHGGLRNPNLFWPGYLEASRIGCFLEWGDEAGSSHDHAAFQLRLPSYTTNISLGEFVKLIEPWTKIQTFEDSKAFHQSQSNQIT